jgi:hypothetical protein
MGIEMKKEKVIMSFNLEPRVLKMLDQYAEKVGLSRSQAANDLMKESIRAQIHILADSIGNTEEKVDPYSLTIREVLDRFS